MTNANETARRRQNAARRAALIAAHGMAPEDFTSIGSRYAATTGELWSWYAKDHGVEAANAIIESC